MPRGKITVRETNEPGASTHTIAAADVEVAEGETMVQRGLMFRTQMPEGDGMFFKLDGHYVHAFWMRNTCIPLDMLFVDDDGLIVGIVENVPTLNDEERRVTCASRYVLEVNAGWVKRHGVKPGQYMSIP
jgi:uncharacterized membrane protein (UPF0127 family)